MTIDTYAYARDKLGKLAVFKINEAVSYEGAIEAVKIDLGVDRALCLVLNKPQASEEPIPNEEAAA
jgi:hypothetical protein